MKRICHKVIGKRKIEYKKSLMFVKSATNLHKNFFKRLKNCKKSDLTYVATQNVLFNIWFCL